MYLHVVADKYVKFYYNKYSFKDLVRFICYSLFPYMSSKELIYKGIENCLNILLQNENIIIEGKF